MAPHLHSHDLMDHMIDDRMTDTRRMVASRPRDTGRRAGTDTTKSRRVALSEISVPDVVLPEQFFSGGDLGTANSPEKRLMFAVLLDAIAQLRRPDTRLAIEAEEWFRDADDDGVFSFTNVCGALGFEPTMLANGILGNESRIAGRAPLRHPRTSRLRITPRRRSHHQEAAVG